MITAEEIAQWVIDHRYPKSENDKVSDHEMYYVILDKIAVLLEGQPVKSGSKPS
jgi:hypothetical protein